MNLTKNFTLAELTYSATAVRDGLDNTPSVTVIAELQRTANMMQRIRDYLSTLQDRDTPLSDISGYRALQVNRAVGSSDTSDHVKGMAADFKAAGMTPYDVCQALAPKMAELGIGQLINELTWVHVGRPVPAKAVNRIITIDRHGTRPGIIRVRL
ncbi:D-Ala-D-Ala carboxypeptidase family metallohydrolase [Duganella aceris]|uniref:Peptidase M15A n=1 Tax=Duganella aceris TaxID=2703883 RepID=A0ABX0FPH4_9BURK|nr:D-Ala-D-Ala carboxypeptidase family metallohydrolase [Duganella aceris]NGZ86401.1 peptidase M15A [Duganella aceris]